MVENYGLNDIVQMKKDHPCKKSHYWKIVRMGVDIKIKCEGCQAVVMMERPEFESFKTYEEFIKYYWY